MEDTVKGFDWHSDPITPKTPITGSYRNTQNVRRFFQSQCGTHFKFDRSFMAWLKDGASKTMGEAVEEWQRRKRASANRGNG
jgi:hypothetical protein